MPKKENTPEVPENSDAKEIQKWSVWTQGPKDAKETKRKFKQITPGQSRDYKYLVKNRKMQRYEEVILTAEDAPTMSAGTGGFSSNPEKSGVDGYDPILGGKTTKVYRRKPRLPVDGRTKGYREAVKRILDRNHKRQQQEIAQRLSQFGVSSNPFQKEETNMSKKYLKTKEGSIEAAVLTSIATEVRNEHNINSDKPILTLPKNRYFKTKEGSIEEAVIEALADKKPTQFTDPDKQKMVGVKDKKGKVHTKVVKKDDPKYANHPEHESVEVDSMVSAVAEVIGDFAETKRGHKRKKHDKGADEDDGTLKKFDDVDKKDDDEDGPKGKKDKLPPWLKKGGKKDDDDDPKGKKKKGKKDKEEVEVDEGSLNPQQKTAREKSRGRFGIGDRKHGNSPQAAHGQGFGTGGDHQNRGVKKVRGAKPQGAYARTREEVEIGEELPVGHRSPSPGSDSTDSYHKLQNAKRKAKAAGKDYDRLPYGDQQKYHEEVKFVSKFEEAVKNVFEGDKPKWGSQFGDSGPKKTPHSQFGDSPDEIAKNKKKYFDSQKNKKRPTAETIGWGKSKEVEVDEGAISTAKSPEEKRRARELRTKIGQHHADTAKGQRRQQIGTHWKDTKNKERNKMGLPPVYEDEAEIGEGDKPKWGSQFGDSGPKKTPHSQFGDSPDEIKKNKAKYKAWQKKKSNSNEEVEVDEGHPGQKAGSHKLKKGYKMTANGDIVRVATNPSVLSKRKDQKDVESSKVNPDKVDYNKEEIECEGKIKDKLKKFGKDLKQQWKNDLKDFDPSRKHRGPAKTHESKEVEAGERDVGSAAYADYVADTTPGEGITSKDAKKSDVAKKKELAYNKHRTTKVDEDSAYQKNVAYDTARHAAKTKYMKITDKGKRALKKGDHKLKITPTGKAAIKDEVEIDELSTELLGKYKTKAAAQSSAASKAGYHKLAHKRYKGVNTATTLQFRNDAKKYDERQKRKSNEEVEIGESDDDLAKAMKAREKFAFAKKQQKARAEHQRTMDRLGNRTSRKEKASGIGRPDANLSQKEGVEEEVKFKVKLIGLPVFYVDGKSVGEIKQSLRRKLKKPNDDIESIERVTTTAVKKDFRSRVSGSKDKDMDGQVDEIHSPKKDQSYYDDNEKFKKKNPKKVTVLKPSLKGMPKKLKDIVRARKEV